MRLVVDIEANNLLNDSSIDYTTSPYKLKDTFRIWCIVTKDVDTKEIRVFREDQIVSEFVHYFKQATTVIAHNGINYDLLVLKLYAGLDYEVEPDRLAGKPVEIIDTMILSKVLNPDRFGGHSLDAWGTRLSNNKIDYRQRLVDLGVMQGNEPKGFEFSFFHPEMITYCTQDVNLTENVYNELIKEKGNWPWEDAIALEKAVAEIITRQEHRGFKFDSELAVDLVKDLDEKIEAIRTEVEPIIPDKPMSKTNAKQYTAPKSQFLKSGLPSTHLKNFVEKHSGHFIDDRNVFLFGNEWALPLPEEPLVTHEKATLKDTTHIKEWLVRDFGWVPTQYKERDLTVNAKKQKLNKEGYEKAVVKYVEQTLASPFCKDRLEHLELTRSTVLRKLLEKDISKPVKVLTNPTFTIGQDKEIDPNLQKLEEQFPYTRKIIEFLTYNHRRNSILGGGFDPEEDEEAETGFLTNVRADGRIATPAGTCDAGSSRFKHRVVCNIPRNTSLYGEQMRELFGCDKDYTYQMGYDFNSLEAMIESHYVYRYKGGPEYGVSLTAEKPNDCHCFDGETEILTTSGWKTFDKVCYMDEVMQVDKKGLSGSFVKPLDIVSTHYSGPMLYTENQKISMVVTPNHRVLFSTPTKNVFDTCLASEVLNKTYSAKIPVAFSFESSEIKDENLLNLIVATQADGHFSKDCSAITFCFTKQRKINSLRNSLNSLGAMFSENSYERFGRTETSIRINASSLTKYLRETLTDSKKLPWSFLNLTTSNRKFLISSIGFWDGTLKNNGDIVFDTRCSQSADVLQALAHSVGLKGVRNSYFKKTTFGEGIIERCYVSRAETMPNMTKQNTSIRHYCGLIGCVTVPSGYIVVRRKGKVFISGNSVLAKYISGIIGKEFPRGTAKSVKYGCSYNAQPKRVTKIVGCDLQTAQVIFDAFWDKASPLKELKENMQKYWETTGQKKFLLGLDKRKLPIRSKGNVINTAFQSAGVICAKRAMVIHDRKLRERGLIVDFFKEDWRNKQFVQQMIAYHK